MTDAEYNEMAVLTIYNYFIGKYTKEYITENFNLALKVLINNIIASVTKPIGIASVSQNGISVNYREGGSGYNAYLTSEVLSLLPSKSALYIRIR